MKEAYQAVARELLSREETLKVAKKGLCRPWTKAALDIISEMDLEIEAEAREVDIEPGLSHTFIKLRIKGKKPFLCDGTGVGKFEPYFGKKKKAPKHLRGSRLDWISRLEEKKHS